MVRSLLRYSWLTLTGLASGLFMPGCATSESGYKISDETIAFIQPGVTTRADVVENLGKPLLELNDPRVVAYSWGKVRATAVAPALRDPGVQERNMEVGV